MKTIATQMTDTTLENKITTEFVVINGCKLEIGAFEKAMRDADFDLVLVKDNVPVARPLENKIQGLVGNDFHGYKSPEDVKVVLVYTNNNELRVIDARIAGWSNTRLEGCIYAMPSVAQEAVTRAHQILSEHNQLDGIQTGYIMEPQYEQIILLKDPWAFVQPKSYASNEAHSRLVWVIAQFNGPFDAIEKCVEVIDLSAQ